MTPDFPTISHNDGSTIVEKQESSGPEVDKSQLINEAVDRFLKTPHASTADSIRRIAAQYRRFGPAVESSIARQLEVEDFLRRNTPQDYRTAAPEWPAPGDLLGSFRVVEHLGSGALARAYLCEDPQLCNRHVVLKVGRGLFQEAQTLGRLQHPHIVPIYSLVTRKDVEDCVICMPFFGRSTLNDAIAIAGSSRDEREPISLATVGKLWMKTSDCVADTRPAGCPPNLDLSSEILFAARALASALVYAHEKGVLHGDIKPSNILVTPEGAPLLLDFNLSGDVGRNVPALGGTLPYMPPEQLKLIAERETCARNTAYDERSDLYSLGACLFHWAAGSAWVELDSDGESIESTACRFLAELRGNATTAARRLRNLDRGVAAMIVQCLRYSPADRPQSAAELLASIDRLLAFSGRLARTARRNWQRVAVLSCAALVAVSAGLAFVANLPSDFERTFDAGVACRAEGDLKNAVVLLRRASQLDPDSAVAAFAFGWTLVDDQRTEEALETFHRFIDSQTQARAAVGYCFHRRGNTTAAIPWYEAAIAHGDRRAAVLNNLAVAYEHGRTRVSRRDNLKNATRCLEDALRTAPDSAVIWTNLAWVHLLRLDDGEVESLASAEAAVDQLMRLSPENGRSWRVVADVRLRRAMKDASRVNEAVDALRDSILRGAGPDYEELSSGPQWALLQSSPRFAEVLDLSRNRGATPRPSRAGEPIRLLPLEEVAASRS